MAYQQYGQPPPYQPHQQQQPVYQQQQPVYQQPAYQQAARGSTSSKGSDYGGGGGDPSGAMVHGGGAAAQAINASPPWQDKWWALAFILQLIAVFIVGGICYQKYHEDFRGDAASSESGSDLGPLKHAFPLLAVCVGVALIQAVFWMSLMRNHGETLIWITLIFGLFVSGASVIMAAMAGSIVGVVLGGLFFLLNLWYVYSVRHKIPFAAAMLDVSLKAMSDFKSAWLLPIWGMLLMSGLAFLWSVCAMSIVWAVDHGGNDSAYSVRGLIFFLLALSLFWTILTVKSWVHTSVSGVCATWYFLSPHAVPENPVWHAVKRASTTSFGSICFGSFIVAFIRTVRFFVNLAYQNARNSNNQLAACALCCLECLIGLLESVINYVNQYAFAICAIYGKPFLAAASDAWELMRSRGFDAVINDSLIGGVLAFAQIIAGLLTGLVAALIAYYGFDTDWRQWAGVGFLIGVMLMVVVTEVVESAVITLFICLADDPSVLQRTKPAEYSRIMDPLNQSYPARGQQNAYGARV